MNTTDNATLHRLYDSVTVASKRFSGIVGDAKHAASGGYHIGRRFVPATDYSAGGSGRNTSPRDAGGDAEVACAIDISFSTADMIAVTNRLLAACGTSALRGVREFNGTSDGVITLNRDAVLDWRENYTPDPTHLWHVHIGFFRDTAQDWATLADVADVINGTADLSTQGGNATPIEEDDMTPEQMTEWADNYFRGPGATGFDRMVQAAQKAVNQSVPKILTDMYSGPGKVLFDRGRQLVGLVMDRRDQATQAQTLADAETAKINADQG